MSPCTLHFHIEHLTPQSHGGIKVSARLYISFPPDFSTSQLSCSYPSFFSFVYCLLPLSPTTDSGAESSVWRQCVLVWRCEGAGILVVWLQCSGGVIRGQKRGGAMYGVSINRQSGAWSVRLLGGQNQTWGYRNRWEMRENMHTYTHGCVITQALITPMSWSSTFSATASSAKNTDSGYVKEADENTYAVLSLCLCYTEYLLLQSRGFALEMVLSDVSVSASSKNKTVAAPALSVALSCRWHCLVDMCRDYEAVLDAQFHFISFFSLLRLIWGLNMFLHCILLGSGRVIKLSLPLYLEAEGMTGDKTRQPYRELCITITCQPPRITVQPPQILLTPVPLESTAAATLTLLASGYPRLVYSQAHTHTHSYSM